MWKRIFWQYSQRKLLYYPLSPFVHWLLRGIFDEWLFSRLTAYTETRVGVIVDIIKWAEVHPSLSIGILVIIIAVIVAIWAVRDAKKKLKRIYEIEDILLKMFNLALGIAELRAQTISLDAQWDTVMKRIAKDIVGIDATKYSNKDMKDKREIAKIEKEVKRTVSTDEETVPIFKQIASAMVNNGYGITEELEENRQNRRLKHKLEALRKVPSRQINDAINKCLEYIYILSHIYIYHLARMRNTSGIGEATLAQFQNFIQEQRNNTGDMSKCLTELRIEIVKFIDGGKDGERREL